jgi:hypothetical protein
MDLTEKRGEIIKHLRNAFTLADEIGDGETGILIERALDAACSRLFRLLADNLGRALRRHDCAIVFRRDRPRPSPATNIIVAPA